MAIKIYGFHLAPYVRRVILTLLELGVPVEDFEIVPLNSVRGDQKVPEHLAHQPFGKVPYIDDEGFILFESRAIMTYLADKYSDKQPGLLGEGVRGRALVRQYVDSEGFNYLPAIQPFIFQSVLKPALGLGQPDETIVEESKKKVEAYLDILDKQLEGRSFLAGDKLTVADLTHVPFTELVPSAGASAIIDSRPNVKAWWERVTARQSWKQLQEKFPYVLS